MYIILWRSVQIIMQDGSFLEFQIPCGHMLNSMHKTGTNLLRFFSTFLKYSSWLALHRVADRSRVLKAYKSTIRLSLVHSCSWSVSDSPSEALPFSSANGSSFHFFSDWSIFANSHNSSTGSSRHEAIIDFRGVFWPLRLVATKRSSFLPSSDGTCMSAKSKYVSRKKEKFKLIFTTTRGASAWASRNSGGVRRLCLSLTRRFRNHTYQWNKEHTQMQNTTTQFISLPLLPHTRRWSDNSEQTCAGKYTIQQLSRLMNWPPLSIKKRKPCVVKRTIIIVDQIANTHPPFHCEIWTGHGTVCMHIHNYNYTYTPALMRVLMQCPVISSTQFYTADIHIMKETESLSIHCHFYVIPPTVVK